MGWMNGQWPTGKNARGSSESLVHQAIVEQGHVKTQHIQADEIRAKGRKLVIWIALAMDVTTRLWMAGAVSTCRDRKLIDRLFQHVRACCQLVQGLLVLEFGLMEGREEATK